MINKLVDDDPENWDKYINKALSSQRVGTHESTQISTYEAMYARKPILSNQASLGPVVQQTEFGDDVLNDLQVRKRYIEKNIHENVQVAQGRQKKQR